MAATNRLIDSKLNFSDSSMRMFTTQHDRPFRLILYWNQTPPSGSSCVGRESSLTSFGHPGILNLATSGSSSVVEHRLAKARVASSNLVSRSIPPSGASRVGYGGLERSAIR